jgi:hypothetical protein
MSIFGVVLARLRQGTTGQEPSVRGTRSGLRRTLVGGATTALAAGFMVAVPGSANAAVPTFPDNIIVFPDRDFVSVEGYEDHVGETATLEVTRPGVGLVGSAQAVVEAGGVAFEVNHPGGVCWGAGTGLKVTPDIVAGDVVSIRFGAVAAGDVRTLSGTATSDAVQNGATVTVSGTIGPDVVQAQTEQRIIEPALRDTAVGRRDIRAIPGPLVAAATGGYSSSLLFPTATTWVATYVFDDPDGAGPQTGADIAAIAANATLGERLMGWEVVDAVGNRQGITIAEFGEAGGPGVGGCPNGPLQSGPPGPTSVVAARQANGDIKVTWTPAVAIPGTPAITGYRIHAVGDAATTTAVPGVTEQVELGKRINGAAATGTTLTGLGTTATYSVEVVSVSSVGETFPAITAIPVTDVTPPTVTANPAAGSFAVPQQVTLTSNEAGSDIYYTVDGSDVLDVSGQPAVTTLHYTGPIAVGTTTTLNAVAFDPSGNASVPFSATYTITNTPTPAAPTFGPATVGQGSITLSWTSNDPSVTGYGIQLYDAAGLAVGALREFPLGTTSTTITGLTPDTPYFATVKAQNGNGYGPESAKLGPLTPQGAVVANPGPDQSIQRRNVATTVLLPGTGSTAGATYAWAQVTADGGNTLATGADVVALTGAATRDASFSLPLFALPQTNSPKFFRLTVTLAGQSKADWVKVTPVPGQVSIATAKFKVGDFRVTGADSVVGATVTVYTAVPSGQGTTVVPGVPVAGASGPVVAAAVGGSFDIRVRNNALPNPGRIFVVSNDGGIAGPFTVT